MKRREDFVVYSKYLNAYLQDERSFHDFTKDIRLDGFEKKLLETRVLLTNKKWNEAVEELELVKSDKPFIKAEKYFLLCTAYIYLSNYEEAAKFGDLAIRYYHECDDRPGAFRSYYNLSVCFNRIGMDHLSHYFLTQSHKYIDDKEQELLQLRALACFYSRKNLYDKAIECLRQGELNIEKHKKIDSLVFKTVAIDIYIRANELSHAKRILQEIICSKINREKFRVHYYSVLINALENKTSITSRPALSGEIKEFALQWDILYSLETGDIDEAKKHWSSLIELFPRYYRDNFKIIDSSEERTIFGRLLQRLRCSRTNIDLSELVIKGKKGIRLLEILISAKSPVRKEDLIEQVWQTPYDPSLDARFYKLIERLREQVPFAIENSRNSYFILDDLAA